MTDFAKPILTAGDDDTTRAYLFASRSDPATHAITRDPEGGNLPASDAPSGWVFERAFALGVREAPPAHIAPEPVLRGLQAVGYFVWYDGSNPKGTSQ